MFYRRIIVKHLQRMVGRLLHLLVTAILVAAILVAAQRWYGGVQAASVRVETVAVHYESAATAPQIAYQARLLDTISGQPKPDGAYTIAFNLYRVGTGGSPLWSEVKSIPVNKGLFTTLLGDTVALKLSDFNGEDLYLGITVGSDPETAPRQRLAHVAYAIYAENAKQLNGLPASAFASSSHTHTGAAIVSGVVADEVIAPSLARDSEVMPLVLAGDGPGSTLDADTLDGLDAGAFARSDHQHDGRYYARQVGTQFIRTLTPGQSEDVFTHSWPEAWFVQWSLRPTTTGGRIQWSGWIERGSNGLLSYWFRVTNVGTVTTDYAAQYAVLQ